MKRARFSEEQIIGILKAVRPYRDAGYPCRQTVARTIPQRFLAETRCHNSKHLDFASLRGLRMESELLVNESQDRQVLLKEARGKAPPGIPNFVISRRGQPTHGLIAQAAVILLSDDNAVLNQPSGTFERPDGRLGVKQHRSHEGDVKSAQLLRKVGGRSVMDIRLGLNFLVREPQNPFRMREICPLKSCWILAPSR